MKSIRISTLLTALVGTLAALQLGVAQAADRGAAGDDLQPRIVKTRSADDCQADLMRDWNHRSSGATGVVRFRHVNEAYADLMRDWDGPDSVGDRPVANSRNAKSTYDDLVRNWGG